MLTRSFLISFFISLTFVSNILCTQCSEDDLECHEKSKYKKEENLKSERWQKYINLIEKAMSSYEECESSNCSCYKNRLELDLEPWKLGGITKDMIQKASKIERMSHYQIIDHKLYRDDDPMFPARSSGIEHFLLKIIKKLPDTEFLLNTRDWPQTSKWGGDKLPVFSFSKVDSQNNDIMYPAWTFWEGGPAVWPIYPNGLGRWDQQMKLIPKEAKKWPWGKKLNKGFFRGSRTTEERDPLVLLSRREPDLVDAQYTKNQAWRSDEDTLGAKPAEEISLDEHCKYKFDSTWRFYELVKTSFRFKHLFLCNSLVFHVGDEWLEFFYDALKPWVHYIPVNQNLSDAQELLEFAKENDKLVKEIALRGKNFITEHLRMDDIYCYWEELVIEYTKLLKYKPKLNKKLKRIQ